MSEHICNHDCHHDTVSCLGSQLARVKEELEYFQKKAAERALEGIDLMVEHDALKEELKKYNQQCGGDSEDMTHGCCGCFAKMHIQAIKERDALKEELKRANKIIVDTDTRFYFYRQSCDELVKALEELANGHYNDPDGCIEFCCAEVAKEALAKHRERVS